MQNSDAGNQRSRETQRANILEGARRVFARKGKAATMADVAEAAGVSQGLAYRYFASKEEIYRELLEQAVQASLETSPPVQETAATPGERLTQMITKMVEYRRDHIEIYQLLDQVLSADKVPDDYRELIEKRGRGFFDAMRQLIVEGQATGEVAAGDPDQLVIAIGASLEGLGRFALHNPEQFHKICPDASIFLRMLKP
ncbi:MAG TPA: TetR/AcrR family transcriptional regulator [Ktedonobacteraceae bacterium]|jgi:AcrR family transcriptional regulator